MLVDIIIKQPETELPPLEEGQMRYVVAQNGIFLERRTTLYSTSSSVGESIAGLVPHERRCSLSTPKVSEEMARQLLSFFRWCYELHGGEAALLLLYDTQRRELQWYCPEQRVEVEETWWGGTRSIYEIQYEGPEELPANTIVLADAHSHGHLSAYPSAVDVEDERYKDGLHIVVGYVNREDVDVYVDFVMDGNRFTVEPDFVLSAVGDAWKEDFPKAWKDRVEVVRKPYPYAWRQDPYEEKPYPQP